MLNNYKKKTAPGGVGPRYHKRAQKRKNTLCAMNVYIKTCVDLFCRERPYNLLFQLGFFFFLSERGCYLYLSLEKP